MDVCKLWVSEGLPCATTWRAVRVDASLGSATSQLELAASASPALNVLEDMAPSSLLPNSFSHRSDLRSDQTLNLRQKWAFCVSTSARSRRRVTEQLTADAFSAGSLCIDMVGQRVDSHAGGRGRSADAFEPGRGRINQIGRECVLLLLAEKVEVAVPGGHGEGLEGQRRRRTVEWA